MQTILVIITFVLATAFLVKRFVWNPFGNRKKKKGGLKINDHSDCSSCSFH
jgi:flagellar biogenesis protein FliO